MKALFILALIFCFAMPAFAIKILPYNVPLQDLMKWDKQGATLKLSNPEGETLSVAWASTVDFWNYDGATWTFDLPSGDTFAFGKGVAVTGVFSATGIVTLSDATDASSLTVASAVFSGGVAITKQLYIGDDIDMSVSGTGVYDLTLKDAVADALSIVRGVTDMIVFDTATPLITITPATTITGALTANGGIVVGTVATGIDFTGTYSSHALDFSNATQVAGDISLIRAGTYTTGMDAAGEAQYGMVRLYLDTDDDGASYNRGVFVCLKTSGTKGIFPISGLAEVLTDAVGPTKAQAAQLIVGLHEAGSNLATAGGDSTAGMYGAWLKVYSIVGSVAANGSKVAPAWIDNQMSGTVSGEEYGIFATTGGTRPDGFIGFETSSSGYDQFIYADTTFNTGAGTCITTDAVPGGNQTARIKVWYDSTQYYIPLYR